MKTAFVWNKGAWFGGQLGGSAWALLLGLSLLLEDLPAALVCLIAFAAFNAYGLHLWRGRDHLSAYAGLLRMQCAFLALCILAIAVVNFRGIGTSESPRGVAATPISYGWLAVPLIFILWGYLRERAARRSST